MSMHRQSYWKTTLLAASAAILVLVVAYGSALWAGLAATPVIAVGWLLALPLLATAAGGWVVLYRDARAARGQHDLFLSLVETRTEAALAAGTDGGLQLRRWLRVLLPTRQLLVGEYVEIATWEEVARTLDDQGRLDGLSFQPEMLKYCGQRAQVFRLVDKIYDYGGKKNLRRLRGTVLLRHLRCDGAAHDGCQTGCYLLWKRAWLRPVTTGVVAAAPASPKFPPQKSTAADGSSCYTCQFTQLVGASSRLSPWDIGQDLRPLLAGNLTLSAFVVAMLTRLFNGVQAWRGGTGFPFIPASSLTHTPTVSLGLVAADEVSVQSADAISRTLDSKGKNRGMWFDPDMVKHCGQRYQVLKRVDRIIDDASGRMLTMKTPCIVLQGVSYSGEGLRFCAQQDPTFWREAWLQPVKDAQVAAGSAAPAKTTRLASVGPAS